MLPGRLALSQWRRIVPATLIGLFLAEVFVMMVLDRMGIEWGVLTALLDALMLTVLVLPGLYFVVLRPIEHLAAEAAAATANARFRAVFEAASDAIIVGDSSGRIRSANPAAAALLGYATDELEGAEIAMLVPDDRREEHRNGLRRYVKGGQGKVVGAGPVEMEALSKRGHRIPVEISLSAPTLHAEGLLVGVIRDLRQRRRLGLYEVILPVCCVCGVIRDDTGTESGEGHWLNLEDYVEKRSAARFSHTFCPKCHAEWTAREGLEP